EYLPARQTNARHPCFAPTDSPGESSAGGGRTRCQRRAVYANEERSSAVAFGRNRTRADKRHGGKTAVEPNRWFPGRTIWLSWTFDAITSPVNPTILLLARLALQAFVLVPRSYFTDEIRDRLARSPYPDLSQMALSRASFATPLVDSNPRLCD